VTAREGPSTHRQPPGDSLRAGPSTDRRPAGDSLRTGPVTRIALALTTWSERWVPDAFIFALLATALVVAAGTATASLPEVVDAWGRGFWELIPFTLQMCLVIITGHVLASSRPIGQVIRRIAGWPRTPRQAVALVALFAMMSSWFNWGFSLVFSAVLAREVAQRVKDVDYRALAASSFLGLGSIWAQGLSGSAALQMASPGALQPQIRDIVAHGGLVPGGIVSLTHTIFLWQSFVAVAIEIAVVVAIMWFAVEAGGAGRAGRAGGEALAPVAAQAVPAGPPGLPGPPDPSEIPGSPSPAQRLEHSPILSWFVVALGTAYLVRYFAATDNPLNAITLNVINLAFLMVGFLLHGTPARLMRAVYDATPAVWGVILQFPFYAGIAGIITSTQLNERLAAVFVNASTPSTFPPLVALYSAVLGVFVPSGGSKWVIEAPYVMAAAHELNVHLGWVVTSYDLGEALANLVQPFWMLPTLAILGLRARDVMGYTFVVFLGLTPVVMLLVTLLGRTLDYPF
jgi:short-chain fatty acids transporter